MPRVSPGSQVLADSGGSDYGALLLQMLPHNSAGAIPGFLSKTKVPLQEAVELSGVLGPVSTLPLHSHQCPETSPVPVLDQTSEALSYLTRPEPLPVPLFLIESKHVK